jgi:cold shock CspA family protein
MPEKHRGSVRGRLVGKLVGFHHSDKGYAFLSTGSSSPDYFVAKSSVPAGHWFAGSILEFTPAPPRGAGKNMRAENIIPRNSMEEVAS